MKEYSLLRIKGLNVLITLKEFKGSKYPKLVAEVNINSGRVLFHFENEWEVNTFTIYSNTPNLIGSYGFGSDFQLNKRQCTWLRNNRLKLLDMKSELKYKAVAMFNNPAYYKSIGE